MFWKNGFNTEKEISNIKIELSEINVKINSRVDTIFMDLEKIKTHISSLRGLVNRKIGNTESEPEENKTEDIKSPRYY